MKIEKMAYGLPFFQVHNTVLGAYAILSILFVQIALTFFFLAFVFIQSFFQGKVFVEGGAMCGVCG